MNNINICFATDNNYAPYMGVAIYSILKNSKQEDNFRFYILDGGIRTAIKEEIISLKSIKNFEISFLRMDKDKFDALYLTPGYITIATFYRFIIHELLPDINKILYLDCDLIVLQSLAELFNNDISCYACAGVSDIMPEKYIKNTFHNQIKPGDYVNAGVLLINCKYWREGKYTDKLFSYVIDKKPAYNDQDAINYIFKGKIKLIPYKYNTMTGHFEKFGRKLNKNDIIIRHYTSKDKPWLAEGFQPMNEIFKRYMMQTPWSQLLPVIRQDFFYWFKKFLKYIYIHPLFFIKTKFYTNLINMGFKATIR